MKLRTATPSDGLGVPMRMLLAGAFVGLLAIGTSLGVGWGRGSGSLPGVPGLPRASHRNPGATPRFARSIDGVARPIGVAVAPDGRVYLTEGGGARRIRAFDADGIEDGSFAPPGSASRSWMPMYVAVSPGGDVYVTDAGTQTIHVLARDGSFLRDVASPDGGWSPLGIAFAPDGRLLVTDVTSGRHRVLVFDANEALLSQFGTEGAGDGEFSFPNAVAVDRQGRIYVSDSNNRRVQVFDADGRFLSRIGGQAGRLAAPRGIAIDGDDRLYVVDTVDGDVHVFDVFDTPNQLVEFGGAPGTDGTASYPNGIALGAEGRIYVTDREGNRVQVWSKD
ncbi:MAG: 6-bladed beta-propeller [Dehalococcoidia bacterium]|nr:MAG: 6-bladed beta-propeller [Dehalococcoidia bacterium]